MALGTGDHYRPRPHSRHTALLLNTNPAPTSRTADKPEDRQLTAARTPPAPDQDSGTAFSADSQDQRWIRA